MAVRCSLLSDCIEWGHLAVTKSFVICCFLYYTETHSSQLILVSKQNLTNMKKKFLHKVVAQPTSGQPVGWCSYEVTILFLLQCDQSINKMFMYFI